MPLYVVIACLAVVLSVQLFGWAFVSTRQEKLVRRNLRLDNRNPAGLILPPGEGGTPVGPSLSRLVSGVSRRIRPITPEAYVEHIERRIHLSGLGHRLTVDRLLTAKVVVMFLTVLFGIWRSAAGSNVWLGLSVVAALVCFMLPDLVLDSRGKARQTVIERELPDVLDQLTISIEAGLGFDAALRRVVQSNDGPLSAEFTRTLQDIQFGVPRGDAIGNMIERTDVLDLRLFASALNQATKYGVPLAHVMRIQATDLREKRQMRAEERAAKMPVKLSMPLILCILPTLFIVLLGPAAIRFAEAGLV